MLLCTETHTHTETHTQGNVFTMHNRSRIEVFCYALSPNDGSQWRQRIEAGTEHFIDASSWGTGEVCFECFYCMHVCLCLCVYVCVRVVSVSLSSLLTLSFLFCSQIAARISADSINVAANLNVYTLSLIRVHSLHFVCLCAHRSLHASVRMESTWLLTSMDTPEGHGMKCLRYCQRLCR